jgi:1-deoxy-D-xylulose-5-phosphate synthase
MPYRRYAAELGVLFQIVDDILDVTGTDDALGKPQGSDERHGKRTYVTEFGLDRARELADECHATARGTLTPGGAGRCPRARADHRLHPHPDHLTTPMTRILDRIDDPRDLHALDEDELGQVAQEVREHIIDTVGEIGGHFGANLGTCELAVALHSLLESPQDKILWDVGHQAYPHKVLTGRRDQLPTIRQYEGLAPFCSIAESEHDIMGAGHASTSIGYAVGLKEAMRLRGETDAGKVVAVIGDGGLTGGVAFEAIHQAGGLGTPIVVVLNDNGMSIAPNVGALSRYFNRVRLNPKLWHAREGVEDRLTELPAASAPRSSARAAGQGVDQGVLGPGLLVEELDWAYIGVIDGHDVSALRPRAAPALDADRPSSCTSPR